MAIDKWYKALIPIYKSVIYGHCKWKKQQHNIIINWIYFKLMTITNSGTNGHQMEMYVHAFTMNIKKEN